MNEFWNSGSLVSLNQNRLLIAFGRKRKKSFAELGESLPAFYYPDFFIEDLAPWVQYDHYAILSYKEFYAFLQTGEVFQAIWQIGDFFAFEQAFWHLKDLLNAQILKKGVPYAFVESPTLMDQNRLKRSLQSALFYAEKYPFHLYGSWDEERGFLGLTPEKLFSSSDPSRLSTEALAGTRQKTDDFTLKEEHEHQLVVDGICFPMREWGALHVHSRERLSLPTLCHLRTKVDVKLNKKLEFEEIVRALHPTPALGAFPKQAGESWLRDLDKHMPRGHFGAPVGYLFNGHQACYVAIRQVQWNLKGMRIGAGCGVVEGSVCEKEWDEILLKIKAVKQCLNL